MKNVIVILAIGLVATSGYGQAKIDDYRPQRPTDTVSLDGPVEIVVQNNWQNYRSDAELIGIYAQFVIEQLKTPVAASTIQLLEEASELNSLLNPGVVEWIDTASRRFKPASRKPAVWRLVVTTDGKQDTRDYSAQVADVGVSVKAGTSTAVLIAKLIDLETMTTVSTVRIEEKYKSATVVDFNIADLDRSWFRRFPIRYSSYQEEAWWRRGVVSTTRALNKFAARISELVTSARGRSSQ